ncbi:MAG: hypothetical protein EPO55_18400 [Reyranella sp.]|uniref:hypothetical protein n=1 Tax=Reyranella sp. TaxID=1929291 RepID=UPI0011FFE82A|nr:hypothetical protein [Reyranella sp.]TAJ37594.1 MAG: hypothetical protein EPO55_18400 [Reyranella sp.]
MPNFRSKSRAAVALAACATIATAFVAASTIASAQTSSCVRKQVLTINARILDVWKGKNATHFAVDVRPYAGCRIVNVVVTAPPSSCTKGAQISATGEIDESEGPQDGFEMWKTTTVACRR